MQNIKYVDGGICAPVGFMAAGMQVGISHKPLNTNTVTNEFKPKKKKNDLGLIVSDTMCSAAAVYTQNKVKGAPIVVTKKHLADGLAKAVIVNSKNANTCNADGEEKADAMCKLAANALKIDSSDVIVASTGVIGQVLDITPIEKNIDALADKLSYDGSDACATAIMTTDTKKKEYAVEFMLKDKVCHIGGISKGSGMIHPNMATTLSFLTSDVSITPSLLHTMLSEVVKVTFNRISIDGDQSTNDMACIMANGLAKNELIDSKNDDYMVMKDNLLSLMTTLAKDIAADGEGATKLLECTVSNAPSELTAETIAKSVIQSTLFKTAMFGEDANWGRILCAVGYADAEFDICKVDVSLESNKGIIQVCKNGAGVEFSEEKAKTILEEDEIKILIDLKQGNEAATAWGCDLTYDYVKINGDYRS